MSRTPRKASSRTVKHFPWQLSFSAALEQATLVKRIEEVETFNLIPHLCVHLMTTVCNKKTTPLRLAAGVSGMVRVGNLIQFYLSRSPL